MLLYPGALALEVRHGLIWHGNSTNVALSVKMVESIEDRVLLGVWIHIRRCLVTRATGRIRASGDLSKAGTFSEDI